MKSEILVVGDVMLDRYWFGDVHRISPEAPVPVVKIDKRDERLGGAANVARNIQALGHAVGLLGVIGADEAGSEIEKLLAQAQISSYLAHDSAISTIVKLRVIGRQQQLLRIDFEEKPSAEVLANKLLTYQQVLAQTRLVVFSDYAKGSLQDVRAMLAEAKAAGKLVLVDPKGHDFSPYTGADLITPNRGELKQIVGDWRDEQELTEKAQNLRQQLALPALLLTRSEEGMSLYTADQVHHVPTLAREVFDVSGAGDTVIATLAAMLAEGRELIEAVHIANRAAGIVVGKLGTATVSHSELFAETD